MIYKKHVQKISIIKVFFAGLSLLNQIVFAYPILYNTAGSKRDVKNKTMSTLLADSIDKNKFWVLPPPIGKVIPSHFSASDNISYCNHILELQGQTKDIMNQINDAYTKITDSQDELFSKKKSYDELNQKTHIFYIKNRLLSEVKSKQDQVQNMDYNLSTYRAIYNAQCLNEDSRQFCSIQKQRIDLLSTKITDLNKEISNSIDKNKNIFTQYQELQDKTSAAYLDYTIFKDQLDLNLKVLNSLKNQIYSSYKYYSTLFGGTAQIHYDTGWQKNVDALVSENKGTFFEKVPTKNVRLYANAPANDDIITYLSQLPILLSYTIGNVKFYPFSANSVFSEDQFSDQIQANLDLSLMGSCSIKHPSDYNSPKNSDGIPYFNISLSYQYPLAYDTEFNFRYNLYQIYQSIKTSSDKNYLDERIYEVVFNKMNDQDAFQYQFYKDDLSFEKMDAIKKDVQSYLLSKILKEMTYPGITKKNKSTILENSYNGVFPPLKSTSTCLILNFACISDTWFLKDGTSIFGSLSNDTLLNKQYNHDVTEFWSLNSVYDMPGFTTFE